MSLAAGRPPSLAACVAASLVAASLAGTACGGGSGPSGARPDVASAVTPGSAPSARATTAPPATTGPRWEAARSLDPMDLAQLADEEGASRLLAVAQGGGSAAERALRALPYAGDAEAVLGELCGLAVDSGAPPAALAAARDALAEVALAGPSLGERLAGTAPAECLARLRAMSDAGSISDARLEVARVALEERWSPAPRP